MAWRFIIEIEIFDLQKEEQCFFSIGGGVVIIANGTLLHSVPMLHEHIGYPGLRVS